MAKGSRKPNDPTDAAADPGTDGGDTGLVETGADELATLRDQVAKLTAEVKEQLALRADAADALDAVVRQRTAAEAEVAALKEQVARMQVRVPAIAPEQFLPPAPPPAKVSRYRISVPGTHVGERIVSASSPAEAIEKLKAELGVITFGAGPVVERIEE